MKETKNGSPVFDKIVSKRQLKNNTSTNKIVKHFFSLKKLCYINVCSGQEEREKFIFLTKPKKKKKKDPRQTYTNINAHNLQYRSRRLMAGNNNVYKTLWNNQK